MIRDLLNPALGYLELREDSKGVIQVAGITEVSTINAKEASLVQPLGQWRGTFTHVGRRRQGTAAREPLGAQLGPGSGQTQRILYDCASRGLLLLTSCPSWLHCPWELTR